MKKLLAAIILPALVLTAVSVDPKPVSAQHPDDYIMVYDGNIMAENGSSLGSGFYYDTGTSPLPTLKIQDLSIAQTSGLQAALDSKASASRSFNYTTRSLDTCFRPSATRDAQVNYSVDIATVSTLAGGQVGTVYLEIFDDSGCTTGTQEVVRFVNGNTQTLGLSVTMNQNVTGTLSGIIPAGKYVKIRTQNNTGTPTFTARPGQEVLL